MKGITEGADACKPAAWSLIHTRGGGSSAESVFGLNIHSFMALKMKSKNSFNSERANDIATGTVWF
jgi:hypothetical protein